MVEIWVGCRNVQLGRLTKSKSAVDGQDKQGKNVYESDGRPVKGADGKQRVLRPGRPGEELSKE